MARRGEAGGDVTPVEDQGERVVLHYVGSGDFIIGVPTVGDVVVDSRAEADRLTETGLYAEGPEPVTDPTVEEGH